MKYLLTIIGIVAAMGLGGMLFTWSGLYDIAATEPHWDATVSLINTLRDRSIAVHSRGIQAPNLDDPQYRRAAVGHYHGMCRLCHGAPGAHTNEFAEGLYPSPPDLTSGAVRNIRSAAEMYWIVKHGIKMTGMPAFGPTHDEKELWGLVALARALPGMSAEAYAGETDQHSETSDTGHSHA
ncbi:MAG TPA: cytochrome c, partial [Desulfosarcina sp.]|nr:cytochrome c [Desulfosarcina sp.]